MSVLFIYISGAGRRLITYYYAPASSYIRLNLCSPFEAWKHICTGFLELRSARHKHQSLENLEDYWKIARIGAHLGERDYYTFKTFNTLPFSVKDRPEVFRVCCFGVLPSPILCIIFLRRYIYQYNGCLLNIHWKF